MIPDIRSGVVLPYAPITSGRGAPSRNRGSVAGDAQLRVLSQHLLGIESRSMRIEAASSHYRVAGQAVPFDVARHAAFQRLACGLPVAQRELPAAVVVPLGTQQRPARRQSRL